MVKQFVFVSVISLNHAAKVRRFLERRKRFSNNCVRTQYIFDSYQQNGQNQHFFGFSRKNVHVSEKMLIFATEWNEGH